ncbi:uncharacterized protein MONBRDRAFT_10409 [Monosiga brevicollis MX1]|uniref:RRM domain-containing protein n=1 Tax=Monosiga brevicollis TaxID=81824 RepID=A9V647_MONBE|nr:uncharacterized protein MONBRDRAFT_10409 [Monosiga brevicollis MX1]EDQ86926.1 predicted protein [Monosiga brevicollis MX1]|eukprot:XP_001748165.1 hypothetical protein [Monosiga brevicollis MX1]
MATAAPFRFGEAVEVTDDTLAATLKPVEPLTATPKSASKAKKSRKSPAVATPQEVGQPAEEPIPSPTESESEPEDPEPAPTAREVRAAAKAARDAAQAERTARTIFVGNLPATVKAKALKELFADCGEIESIRLRTVVRCCCPLAVSPAYADPALRKRLASEQSSMNAYVVFTADAAVTQALTLFSPGMPLADIWTFSNGVEFQGHHLRVTRAETKTFDLHRSIFVGNLPFDASEEELHGAFDSCGTVEGVRIVRDKKYAIGKGFAYVLFELAESVGLALMKECQVRGRTLRVSRCRDANVIQRQKLKAQGSGAQRRLAGKPGAKRPVAAGATTSSSSGNGERDSKRSKGGPPSKTGQGSGKSSGRGSFKGKKGKKVELDQRGKKPRHKPRGEAPTKTPQAYEGVRADPGVKPKVPRVKAVKGRAKGGKKKHSVSEIVQKAKRVAKREAAPRKQ